jgi:hypothetical protein
MEGEVTERAEKSVDNCALSELRRAQPFTDSSIPAALEGAAERIADGMDHQELRPQDG